jgi:hypothetical protein
MPYQVFDARPAAHLPADVRRPPLASAAHVEADRPLGLSRRKALKNLGGGAAGR